MSEIEEKTVLKKVYFITEIDGDKFCPDFFNSYCLDASQRLLSKCKVIDESDGSDDPVMRCVYVHECALQTHAVWCCSIVSVIALIMSPQGTSAILLIMCQVEPTIFLTEVLHST